MCDEMHLAKYQCMINFARKLRILALSWCESFFKALEKCLSAFLIIIIIIIIMQVLALRLHTTLGRTQLSRAPIKH